MATTNPTTRVAQPTPDHQQADTILERGLMEFCSVHNVDCVTLIDALYHLDGNPSRWTVKTVSAGYRTDRVMLRIEHAAFEAGDYVILEEAILPGDDQRFSAYSSGVTEHHALITDTTLNAALVESVREANRLLERRQPTGLLERGSSLLSSLL